MKLRLALLLSIIMSLCVATRAARACGGGVVTIPSGTIAADAQRILISVHGGVTDVVTQIGVPETSANYGVLIPVPSEPTLDAKPVPSSELDTLFSGSAPQIVVRPDDDGIGCGCPVATGSKGGADSIPGGAQVSTPVTIGPVTAVMLTADTGAAINAWLADNGFAIPPADQPIVDAYAGPGRYFIAIRRNDTTATGGATSVGIHFSLAGDARGLPLRFARIGAGATVGFTVIVVSDATVAPSPPFAALTLGDLDATTLKSAGYAQALSAAVAQHGGHAFVLENAYPLSASSHDRLYTLHPFLPAGAQVTRLSTLVSANALDTDVAFDQPFTDPVQSRIYVQRSPASGGRAPAAGGPELAFGFALIAVAAGVQRRGGRRARR